MPKYIDINPSTTDNDTRKLMRIPLSNFNIEKYGITNIVSLKDISKMTSLEQVFNGYNYVILFMRLDKIKNDGHWIMMFINSNDELMYFDSYAYEPLKMVTMIPDKMGQNLNLLELIKKSKYKNKFYYNNIDYQASNTSVCGRYCVLCAILNKTIKSFNFTKLKKYMDKQKQLTGKSYDFIVAELVDRTK